MSSAITRLSRSDSGMSLETIRWARPSTIAVLPTPGSPISTGLFLVRRESTWMTRRISSSRPITGSSFPCSAISVRSRPKRCSGLCSSSGGCAAGLLGLAAIGSPVSRADGRAFKRRARVCGAHDLAAAIGHELGAEGAAHLLELFGELHLGVQRLDLEVLDSRVHLVDLRLQREHALDAGEVETEVGGHLLDAAQPVDILLGVQARALGRALGLDQAARLVHAQRLRMHLRELGGDGDHEHAAAALDGHTCDAGDARTRHRRPPSRPLPPWRRRAWTRWRRT